MEYNLFFLQTHWRNGIDSTLIESLRWEDKKKQITNPYMVVATMELESIEFNIDTG